MRLIDADALLSECKLAQKETSYDRQYANAFYSASGDISTEWWCVEDMIEDAPTIEPERKKGKWTATYSDCGGDVWVSWKCSNCGYVRKKGWEYTDDGKKPNALFCEICNADMREGGQK